MSKSRDRFHQAMHHLEGDRLPMDIGGTSLTSMSASCQVALLEYLGLTGAPAQTNNETDERILEWVGTDFRAVGAIIDLPSPHTRTISTSASIDCWGVRRETISGYDEITYHPLKNATIQDLRNYPWPKARVEEKLLLKWEERARKLKSENEYVIIAEHPVYGILELGCWMCGYDDFLARMAGDPGFVVAFFDKIFEIQLAVINDYYAVLGPYIDLTTSGDDFGMQTGPLISPRMFERFIAPYFRGRIRRTKELAGCYYWHHTCGSVFALLDQIITCGVDILNPIQTSAAQMSPSSLKDNFGGKLVFWGGVDVQHFLPNATPDEVRLEVRNLGQIFGRDGGYVMAPAHNMQEDIPPQNIVAWVETALDCAQC